MALRNPFKNVFSTLSSKFAEAGSSFRTYRLSLGQLLAPIFLYREYKRYRESKQFHRVKDIVRTLPPLRYVPDYMTVITERNIKAKFQYLFNYDLTLTNGTKTGVLKFSVLSDTRMTILDASEYVKKEIIKRYEQSELKVQTWHLIYLEAEIKRDF
ncbi:MAG: hypothetical protein V3U19_03710 [Thermodesulfobacteriota bacterium]